MRAKIGVPQDGDERTVTKFLFLPLMIGDEQRWLEKATYKQKFGYDPMNGFVGGYVWINIKWIDDND